MLKKIPVWFLSLFILSMFITGCDSKQSPYDEAKKAYDNGEYYKAMEAFMALGDYKDAEEQALSSASLLVAESWSGKAIYYSETKQAVRLLYEYKNTANQNHKVYTYNLDNLLKHRPDLYYEFLDLPTPTKTLSPTQNPYQGDPVFSAWSEKDTYTALSVTADAERNEITIVWNYINISGDRSTYTQTLKIDSVQTNGFGYRTIKSWPIGSSETCYGDSAGWVHLQRIK